MRRSNFPMTMIAMILGVILANHARAATITGLVRNGEGKPLAGMRVRAFDEDTFNADDFMGAGFTGEDGRYTITYDARNWDARTIFRPSARHPDVYVVVELRCGDRFTERTRSRTHGDVRPSHDLVVDLTVEVPVDPDCTICGSPACCRRSGGFWIFGRHCHGSCADGVSCVDRTSNWLGATSCGCAIPVP